MNNRLVPEDDEVERIIEQILYILFMYTTLCDDLTAITSWLQLAI